MLNHPHNLGTTSSVSFTTSCRRPRAGLQLVSRCCQTILGLAVATFILTILAAVMSYLPSVYAFISRPFYCKHYVCFQFEEALLEYTVQCMTVVNENACLYIKKHEYSLKSDKYSNKLKSQPLTWLGRSYL